jgi:hypothetical protein
MSKNNESSVPAVVPEQNVISPEMLELLQQDAGSGLGELGRDDLAIPRLSILQAQSPQVMPRDEHYVEGAGAGDILDNVALKAFAGDTGFTAIVVSYRKSWLEWVPRAKGGGFVADHGDNPSILATCKEVNGDFITPEGNEIVKTAEYFLLRLEETDGGICLPHQCVVSMVRTQLKHSRRLNTLMTTYQVKVGNKMVQAPIFYRTYRFKTGPEKNDKGAWFGWVIEPGPDTLTLSNGEDLYRFARNFLAQIKSGDVKVAEPVEKPATETEAF